MIRRRRREEGSGRGVQVSKVARWSKSVCASSRRFSAGGVQVGVLRVSVAESAHARASSVGMQTLHGSNRVVWWCLQTYSLCLDDWTGGRRI